jgi:hypothetical protein
MGESAVIVRLDQEDKTKEMKKRQRDMEDEIT